VVSTELGTGTSWINQDGVTGLVVAPRDPQALAAALRKLLLDGETRSRMGQAARLRAATEFDVAVMMDRVESIYREVAA
jgi:rhamnosyl/mannosyltransferase